MTAEVDLLETWERGQPLSPAARLLHLAGEEARDLPVGAAVALLLERHRALFGPMLHGVADCVGCGIRLEVACSVDALLDAAPVPTQGEHALLTDDDRMVRFRLPTLADLAALDHALDEETGALALLAKCLIDEAPTPSLLAQVSTRMAELDPLGDPEFFLCCAACGASFARPLDAAAFLWQETVARAQRLIGQVDALARAYGWAEADILAMSPVRRQAYLELAGA
jgi:hypothetical protein